MNRRDLLLGTAAVGVVAAVSGVTWLSRSDPAPAGPQPLALIYRGPASCSGCSESVAALLRSSPTKFHTEYCGPGESRQISPGDLADATVYVQPGGGEVSRAWRRLRDDSAYVRDFVDKGGTYLGFCLGAYLAAGEPGFGVLPGRVDQYISSPGASTDSDDDTVIPITWRGRQRNMYFQDGPSFRLNDGAPATVLATYNTGAPAAVVAAFGSGRVGVVGPHPEADQGWYRDAHLSNPDGIRFDLGYDFVETAVHGPRPT
ncbi:BPL-N domain-containing protein [Hamadaea tsunoensis]|uniref:BPL-N domain-containing protein n=1 Tax=Hamadaea tsunoensis TaxID=53368 RepID=UPI00040A6753|nr:BPL-N domain-containing protein [Hamadaea tsunoensis]